MNREIARRLDLSDDQTFKLGDTIDVKNSIALVAITFLAGQSASLTALSLQAIETGIQFVSVGALVAAALSAFVALWPREYATDSTDSLVGWVGELRSHYAAAPDVDAKVAEDMATWHIRRTKERIIANTAINQIKSRWMNRVFIFTGVALACNLATITLRNF
ncbi:MAG: hypothetical protein ACRD2N_20230 [Vicinamibacterales bacterium]